MDGKRTLGPLIPVITMLILSTTVWTGCLGGRPEAKSKVDEAVKLVSSSQPLLEDLLNLDERFNTLGTRYTEVEETIAEGKSLAEMALLDVDELESRYSRARDLLREVMDMEGAGDYAEYARLALAAVDLEMEAFSLNRRLLTTVSDMLDVLPLAESLEQLSYYVGEIDRLTREISDLLRQGADAAEAADAFYRERRL